MGFNGIWKYILQREDLLKGFAGKEGRGDIEILLKLSNFLLLVQTRALLMDFDSVADQSCRCKSHHPSYVE